MTDRVIIRIRLNTSLILLVFALVFFTTSWMVTLPRYHNQSSIVSTGIIPNKSWTKHINEIFKTDGIANSESINWTQIIPNAGNGCGQICEWDTPGIQSLFFQFIKKDFDCIPLWSNPEIDMGRTGLPTPLDQLSSDFLNDLTNNRTIPITPYQSLLDQSYLGGVASLPTWDAETINEWSMQCSIGVLEGNYGKSETSHLLRGLLQVPSMQTANVLVIGSENPWVEACVLAAGSTNITTLEYGRIDSRHPHVKTLTPFEMRGRYQDLSEHFDVIVTFSSVEHAGLGRYGDKLNPWGDRQAIARAWCATKPGGYLVIGVPYGHDAIEYNAHRIYGEKMYPHLVANWYQQWRADSGDQRVHVFRKSLDGKSDPGHIHPKKTFCLVGPLYGRSNNQILSISWARMLARRQKLTLMLTTSDGPDYLFRNWVNTFGNVPDVRWGGTDVTSSCEKSMSWQDAFHDMLRQKAVVPESEWPLITPLESIQAQARLWWENTGLKHGSNITVHGRSFEGTGMCQVTDHSAYPCAEEENLCDYRLHTILDRFRQYLHTGVDKRHIVLFTDGQNEEYAREYTVVEREGNLFVHMWIMVLSQIHIAHPGSTVDYVIWRWRLEYQDKQTKNKIMLPWKCYNNQSNNV